MGALDSQRGGRRHGLKNIILPLKVDYSYTPVAEYLGVKPATVKDWFNGRARKKERAHYESLSEEEKSLLIGRVKMAELNGNPKS